MRRQFPLMAAAFLLFLFSIRQLPAQSPVLPTSDKIVGYLYVFDPHRLEPALAGYMARAGFEGLYPGLVDVLAGWTGDENLALALPLNPVTVVWLDTGGSWPSPVVVFSQAGDSSLLTRSAQRVGRDYATRETISLIGDEAALNVARNLVTQLRDLHEATHPCDFSLYLGPGFWRGRQGPLLDVLAKPNLQAIQSLLDLPDRPPSPHLPQTTTLPEPAERLELPLLMQVLAQTTSELKMVSVQLHPALNRLTLNVEAKEKSVLGAFFD
ncbi:hypothetical protein HQ520_10240, partial [bacterium]|nr:hypothetical protein [bacterium]